MANHQKVNLKSFLQRRPGDVLNDYYPKLYVRANGSYVVRDRAVFWDDPEGIVLILEPQDDRYGIDYELSFDDTVIGSYVLRYMGELAESYYAYGPVAETRVGRGTPKDLHGTLWRGVWTTKNRVGLATYDEKNHRWKPQTIATPIPELDRDIDTGFTFTFDQAGRPVFGWHRLGEGIYVQQFDYTTREFVQRGPFPGSHPNLVTETEVSYSHADNNVVLYHVSIDGQTLVRRFQNELYAEEHLVKEFDSPIELYGTVRRAYQFESMIIQDTSTEVILPLELYPISVRDDMKASVSGPTGGGYDLVVLTYEPPTEEILANVSGPTGGNYKPIVITKEVTDDEVSASVTGPTGGDYRPVVITHVIEEPDEVSATVGGPEGGIYLHVVYLYDGGDDAITATVSGPTGGSYDPA